MTREEVKEKLPIIKAFAEGKTIQFYNGDEWADLDEATFSASPDKYRIKPEPKYRPFKNQEECWQEMQKHQPFGWVKGKDGGGLYLIHGITYSMVTTDDIDSFKEAMYIYKFMDGTPFGIKED